MKRVYLMTFPERLVHAVNAACFVGLIVTGFEIRFGEGFRVLGSMEKAVRVHDALGVCFTASFAAWLLYALATRRIRHLLPSSADGPASVARQARYYFLGIFRGAPYPFAPSDREKFNSIQKATYLVLMLALVPLQIVTGVYLMIAIWRWTEFDSSALLGWSFTHVAAGFLGAAFLIAHVYMATTGARPLASFATIVTGYHVTHED